ncbi:MAG: hypothetical protein ACRDIX_05555 [Actinomycetota bacterium]
MPDAPTELLQRWVHSHEEDTDTEMVFRPADFDFPPSRGRASFELRADGTVLERGIGPTDRPEEASGSWELEGDRSVVLRESATGRERRLEIESLGRDRLVLHK